MQEKLEKLLNTININKDNLIYYEDGKLEKVKIVDNLRLWEVIIKLGSNLPLEVYLELENKIIVIDYKLKNIQDEKYLLQLEGYKKYLKMILKMDF